MMTLTGLLAASNPLDHVTDKPLGGSWVISNVTIMLVVSAAITAAIIIPAAKRIRVGEGRTTDDYRAQGLLANFVEAVCLYLRDEVFKPVLGKDTDKYIGILWTFFWFILVCNILGLVPLIDLTGGIFGLNHGHGIGGTATQSIWVTGTLAFCAFLLINIPPLIKDPVHYVIHLTGGAPWFMWPIIIPVELAGIFVKPFALALRLFANMTGGHVMLAVLFGFVPALVKGLGATGYAMSVIPIAGATAIYMLEVLVAFIQAFIFTFLTGLFLGQLIAHGHDDHDQEDLVEESHDLAVEHKH